MITKIHPDKQKADSLIKMAEITLKRLNEIDSTKYPSNTLKDYYDIIHQLIEALTLSEGVKFRGESAHKELIDYVSKKYSFEEQTRIFLQEMRDYRNRISYEGFNINENYILTNQHKIGKIIDKIKVITKHKE